MGFTPELDGPRLIRPEELRASWRLSQICFGGSDLPEIEPEEQEPAGEHSSETYVITAQGVPVSQISIFFTPLRIYDSVLRIGSIGGVCTHPDYRGYGLATRLLEACTQRLVNGGARLMVISGGRGLYRRVGCVPVGKFATFSVQPGQSRPAVHNVRLRFVNSSDAPMCSRIYQAEPVHFVRPLAIYFERFQPHEIGFHAEEWVVELDGQAAAYLLLNVPWQYISQPGARVRCIAEYAGSRVALASAVIAAASQLDLHELQAPVAWQDADLIHLLQENGCSPEWSSLPGHTNRVINFPAMMADLRSYVQARLRPALRRGLRFEQTGPVLAGTSADLYSIVWGKDRLDLDGAAMTRLVMGDPSQTAQAIPAPGAIAEVISALFPLPSFSPGLDYH